jgi:hypothetical protein
MEGPRNSADASLAEIYKNLAHIKSEPISICSSYAAGMTTVNNNPASMEEQARAVIEVVDLINAALTSSESPDFFSQLVTGIFLEDPDLVKSPIAQCINEAIHDANENKLEFELFLTQIGNIFSANSALAIRFVHAAKVQTAVKIIEYDRFHRFPSEQEKVQAIQLVRTNPDERDKIIEEQHQLERIYLANFGCTVS